MLFADDSVTCDECGNLTEQWGANGFPDMVAHLNTHRLRRLNALLEKWKDR